MSVDPEFEGINASHRYERLRAQAEADRARKGAGTKSRFERLRERLWPHREEPRDGQEGSPSAFRNPGH